MCLQTSKKEINDFKQKHPNKNKTIRVWKVYIVNKKYPRLESLFASRWGCYHNTQGMRVQTPGIVYSDRKDTEVSENNGDYYYKDSKGWDVNQGLHAFSTVNAAKELVKAELAKTQWNRLTEKNIAIVCCHAKMTNYVAANETNEVVFTELYIPKRNFNKAIKEK